MAMFQFVAHSASGNPFDREQGLGFTKVHRLCNILNDVFLFFLFPQLEILHDKTYLKKAKICRKISARLLSFVCTAIG